VGCGWACVIIDRHRQSERKIVWGGWSEGTVNIAELMAYVQGLAYYCNAINDQVFKHKLRMVHIITDSQFTANVGSGKCQAGKLDRLWTSIDALCKQHMLHLVWHFLDRDRIALNKIVDQISRESRLILDEVSARNLDFADRLACNPDSAPYLLYPFTPTPGPETTP
jgi:ribonuclease HI